MSIKVKVAYRISLEIDVQEWMEEYGCTEAEAIEQIAYSYTSEEPRDMVEKHIKTMVGYEPKTSIWVSSATR